jgi:hypothetical protein
MSLKGEYEQKRLGQSLWFFKSQGVLAFFVPVGPATRLVSWRIESKSQSGELPVLVVFSVAYI